MASPFDPRSVHAAQRSERCKTPIIPLPARNSAPARGRQGNDNAEAGTLEARMGKKIPG